MNIKSRLLTTNIRKNALTALLVICGIVLLVISALPVKEKSGSEKSRLDIYVESTEKRLTSAVSAIQGAGKSRVFISAENTFETVYANNASINEGPSGKVTEKSLAYAGNSSYTSEPVVVKELCPAIKGVLVVCEGGNDPSVKEDIINSVSIALGISKNKIHVTGGNS